MDPTAWCLEMSEALKSGEHGSARERALALNDRLPRGGFNPPNHA